MMAKNLKRTDEWPSQDILLCIAQDHANSRLWVGSSDFKIYELDLSKEKPVRIAFQGEHQSYVTGMVRFGEMLVTSSYDRHLQWWDIVERKLIRSIRAHDGWIRRVIASADGSQVISIADDMQCKVWDALSGQAISAFSDHPRLTPHHFPSMLYAVAASADGKWIATGDKVGHVALWDAQRCEKVGELETPVMYTWDPKARMHSIGGIRSLAFSPDSQRLAVGGTGKIGNIDHLEGPARLEVFDRASCTRELELEDKNKKGLIEQIAWSPDQQWIMTAGGDNNGFITIYDAKSGELLHQEGQNGHIHGLACDASFAHIYAAAHERVSRWTMVESPPAEATH